MKKNIPKYNNVAAAINGAGNRLFSVTFTKRTNNEIREMVCRKKVTKHLKGGVLPYDAKSNNLITVFDVAPGKGYRVIPVENIIKIKIDGIEYKFSK